MQVSWISTQSKQAAWCAWKGLHAFINMLANSADDTCHSGKVYDGIHIIAIANKFSFIVMSGERASLKQRSASTESSSLVSNSLQQPIFFYKIKEMVHSSSA